MTKFKDFVTFAETVLNGKLDFFCTTIAYGDRNFVPIESQDIINVLGVN